jgi:hypothetical protein
VNLLYVRREVALRPEVHERTSHVPVWVGHTTTSIPGRAKSVKRHATPCVCAVWMGQLSGTTQGTRWGPRTATVATHVHVHRFGACKRAGGCGWCSPWVTGLYCTRGARARPFRPGQTCQLCQCSSRGPF